MTGSNIVVVGSVNLDIVAHAPTLPTAGETVTNATLSRYPGGKGANQALAACRLGANVNLNACVGADAAAEEALALLREGGVNLDSCRVDPEQATGTALIAVSAAGENQIVVAPGANRSVTGESIDLAGAQALLCQLEVPLAALASVSDRFSGFQCMNLAPAMPVPDALLQRIDLAVVNETEAAFYGELLAQRSGLLAVTHGAAGATLYEDGKVLARATPPKVEVLDTTGAGDTFTAALTVALLEQMPPQTALEFACAAAALSTTRAGAQPSLPLRAEVDALCGRLASD